MNTEDCKKFIVGIISKNDFVREELVEGHGVTKWGISSWSRQSKRTIRDAEDYDWMNELEEDMGQRPTMPLEGCIERVFVHRDADAIFGVITDPTDSQVVAWSFQID